MAIIKCKMCGGDLEITADMTVAECEYCGSKQTIPTADNEKKLTLFSRANRLRFGCEFDKAAGVYEALVADFPEEAEAYWGLVLCKYGIEYVDDPATGKKIPTCHRSSFDSVMDDSNLEQALENADAVARKVYREEAKAIEELRRGIIEVSGKEEPYDIFICYKETAEDGNRTLDSVLAQDVYDALTEKGYRVFFSRITLEDKLGQEYEPYIFAALNSAKIMLAFGTDYEYYNAVWVKNEWSRYLQLVTQDKDKHLIPCYKGIDAYDMPKEFAKLQAQDMDKVGAVQDLLRGIEKLLHKEESAAPVVQQVVTASGSNMQAMLDRGNLALEDGEWAKADEYFDRALDMNAQCAEAYLGKLMAELRCPQREDLKDQPERFDGSNHYIKLLRFASPKLIAEVKSYLQEIDQRKEAERLNDEEARTRIMDQIAKQTAMLSNIPEQKNAIREIESRIIEKKEQKSSLGLFKSKEKKLVQEEIEVLEAELVSVKTAVEKKKDVLQKDLAQLRRNLRELESKMGIAIESTRSAYAESDEIVYAPMPGKPLRFNVTVGQRVEEGDVLLIFEAMLMEIEIFSTKAGIVSWINTNDIGSHVDVGDPLVQIN